MDRAGQPSVLSMKVFSQGRGDRSVACSAPLIQRKQIEAPKERAHPADAFCPEGPCPRATTRTSRNFQSDPAGPPAEPEVYQSEIIGPA